MEPIKEYCSRTQTGLYIACEWLAYVLVSFRLVPWAQAQTIPEVVKQTPLETSLVIKDLGHHNECAAQCFQ